MCFLQFSRWQDLIRSEPVSVWNVALRGEVTANMRAVFIRRVENDLQMRFVLYAEPSEDEIEDIGCIGTETLASVQSRIIGP